MIWKRRFHFARPISGNIIENSKEEVKRVLTSPLQKRKAADLSRNKRVFKALTYQR
jgi:hypothetical protein